MERSKSANPQSLLDASWLRWTTIAFFFVLWAIISYRYPVYFQRDDAGMLLWSQQHSYLDCFTPTKEAALLHDNMYRPFRELAFVVQYRLFGLNSRLYHFTLGVLFILSMAFLFKLVTAIRDRSSAYLTILVWLGAINFLLTTLFWFSDSALLIEMLLACAGLYCFVIGFRKSSIGKQILGSLLMIGAFLSHEPSVVILPPAISVFIACEAHSRAWGWKRSVVYSLLPLLAIPLYFLVFPFATQRHDAMNTPIAIIMRGAIERFTFYSKFLASGASGLILVTPTSYYLVSKGLRAKLFPGLGFLAVFSIAVIITLAVISAHLYVLGAFIILLAGILLPGSCRLLAPWAIIPLFGLCFFEAMFRNYLFEISFALSASAAIAMSILLRDLTLWWKEHIKKPIITYAVVAFALLAVVGAGSIKAKKQAALLKLRSDVTMSLESITSHIKRLPANSALVVVDYESMGWKWEDVSRLPDAQKIRTQGAMLPSHHAVEWTQVIGRNDIHVVALSEYRSHPIRYRSGSRVFLWLMTAKDHEYIAGLKLPSRRYASVRRGQARMDLLEL
ncbi:MAG: hypothetical protein Q7N50_01875 [Armatimonadota bacterium]|nr:hypothetical protein [Armatimonadota bacterium]